MDLKRVIAALSIMTIACPLAAISDAAAQAHGAPELLYLGMSPSVAPTSIQQFRDAIALSINIPRVARAFGEATKRQAIVPDSIEDPRLPGYASGKSDMFPYDPSRARAIISAFGWTTPIDIFIGARGGRIPILARLVASEISGSTGLQVAVRPIDPHSFSSQIRAGTVPIYIVGWVSSPHDFGYPSYSLGITHDNELAKSWPSLQAPLEARDGRSLQKKLLSDAIIVPLVFTQYP